MKTVTIRSMYVGPELHRIMEEHGLTKVDAAKILRCDRREVYRYLKDERKMLACRYRLMLLELGIERPDWTHSKRLRRALAEYI